MIKRFLYLDTEALAQYISALEGGQTTESTTRKTKDRSGKGGMKTPILTAEGGSGSQEEESRTFTDTPEAQFDRLLATLDENAEGLGWITIAQPDLDFSDIGIGAMVSWECDLFVPEVIQMLSSKGEMLEALDMLQGMMPAAKALGLETEGLPEEKEVGAMSSFISRVGAKYLVVGDDTETDWKVSGRIETDYLRSELDGVARVVGKVSKVLSPGHSQPYVTLPGMNMVSREQRRAMTKQSIKPGEEDKYLMGPAVFLDILAIYR